MSEAKMREAIRQALDWLDQNAPGRARECLLQVLETQQPPCPQCGNPMSIVGFVPDSWHCHHCRRLVTL